MTAFSDPIVYGYHSFLGLPIARQAAAYFIARHFLMPEVTSMSTEQALTKINPEHVSLGAGAVALLNTLFFLLGDEGDACLIPAPYYAAFENDMSVVACCVPFAVHMGKSCTGSNSKRTWFSLHGSSVCKFWKGRLLPVSMFIDYSVQFFSPHVTVRAFCSVLCSKDWTHALCLWLIQTIHSE